MTKNFSKMQQNPHHEGFIGPTLSGARSHLIQSTTPPPLMMGGESYNTYRGLSNHQVHSDLYHIPQNQWGFYG